MKREIEILPAAERDIADVYEFIARDSITSATRFVRKVFETANVLLDLPEMGPVRNSLILELGQIRFFPVKTFSDYLIYYRPTPSGISLIRVLHASRDIKQILGL